MEENLREEKWKQNRRKMTKGVKKEIKRDEIEQEREGTSG